MRARWSVCCLLVALLFAVSVHAHGEITIITTREESGESFVEYPVLSGMDNAFAQDSANALVKAAAQPYLDVLALLRSGAPGKLRATASYEVLTSDNGHDVLSVRIQAEGRMPNGRTGYAYAVLSLYLATGQRIGADALFADASHAQKSLDALAEEAFADALSNYLNPDDFLPIPMENVLVGNEGLSFHYPAGGAAWLSGRAAYVRFLWHELDDILLMEDASLLGGLGIPETLVPGGDALARIKEDVAYGALPGIGAKLGYDVPSLLEAQPLLFDPEGFPGATAYYLEDDAYRGTVVLSEDEKTVSGILSTRMNLYGLITGMTTRDDARYIMGEPIATYALNESAARAYGLQTGDIDVYQWGGNELRMHYGVDGILSAFWLQSAQATP